MKPCNCDNTAIQIEDLHTVSKLCPVHGRTYLFRKPGGGYETQQEKQERMKQDRVCELCETEYQLHQHPTPSHPSAGKLCPPCLKAGTKPVRIGRKNHDPKSPWRIGTKLPIRKFVCACGARCETRSTNKFRCDPCQEAANHDCMRVTSRARRAG